MAGWARTGRGQHASGRRKERPRSVGSSGLTDSREAPSYASYLALAPSLHLRIPSRSQLRARAKAQQEHRRRRRRRRTRDVCVLPINRLEFQDAGSAIPVRERRVQDLRILSPLLLARATREEEDIVSFCARIASLGIFIRRTRRRGGLDFCGKLGERVRHELTRSQDRRALRLSNREPLQRSHTSHLLIDVEVIANREILPLTYGQ